MPRGQKICDSCGTATGPIAHSCKNCGHNFAFKPKSREERNTKLIKDINWKELEKGDIIKVSGGPYFYHSGEPITMGYRGKFMVERIDDKGIRAWGIGKQSGFAHIYMGKDFQNPDTGVWKVKHKIHKLKKKEKKDKNEPILA